MKFHYTSLLVFVACVTSCAAQKTAMASTDIGQFLDQAEKNLDFHGTVLMIKDKDTILHKGYCYSDRKWKIPTNRNMAYNIASVSKAFTAIAILKLAEEGNLSLQDLLTKYFKNVSESKAKMTIHHLLSHTSGIGQHYAADGEEEGERGFASNFKAAPADSVGKRFIYSNDNYIILGIITELVTKQPGRLTSGIPF